MAKRNISYYQRHLGDFGVLTGVTALGYCNNLPARPYERLMKEVSPPRLVCAACGQDGHVILPYPHDNPPEKAICPHCGFNNLEENNGI